MYDPKDVRGVPISSGIPPLVLWATVIVIVIIFAIAAMVLATARYGHVWPAANSVDLKL